MNNHQLWQSVSFVVSSNILPSARAARPRCQETQSNSTSVRHCRALHKQCMSVHTVYELRRSAMCSASLSGHMATNVTPVKWKRAHVFQACNQRRPCVVWLPHCQRVAYGASAQPVLWHVQQVLFAASHCRDTQPECSSTLSVQKCLHSQHNVLSLFTHKQ